MAWTDTGGKDAAPPNAPSISGVSHNGDDSQFTASYSSTDNGTIYQYYVEATGKTDGTKIQSPPVTATVVTGLKGYSILIDNSPLTVPDGSIISTAQSFTFAKPESSGFYIHISAVDNAGNISLATHYHVDDMISVTHPISVDYIIDPNSDTPFTVPDIQITNNSLIPIKVSVQSLQSVDGEKITFADVLPTKYEDWSKLTAAQTKSDIALGISIKETDAGANTWAQIITTSPIYAAQITAKTTMGTLNANGAMGNLKLTAFSGLAWDAPYTAKHNLVLVFDMQ